MLAFVIEVQNGQYNVIVGDFRDPETRREVLAHGQDYEATLNEGDEEAMKLVLQRQDLPVRLAPLNQEAHPGLHLAYMISDSEIYRRIEAAGAEITRRVAVMTSVLCAGLVAAFIIVWALVRNQVRLLGENERLDRMAYVGTLASGLAHEICNPLNAMSVNLGVVEEDISDPRPDSTDRVKRILQRLSAEIGQLDTVLNNFLAYALPRESRRERTKPAAAIQDAVDSLEGELADRRIECALELDESLEIDGDPAGLRQTFHNLALNAIQAMDGPKRRLRVRCWKEDGRARIDFEDTGKGIEPEEMDRAFEVFYSSKPGGAGFGLPIAQRIVRDHGGRIWADSTPGKGATFHLEFPLS
ncbi:MAG: HAMP domain-containing sensor histidine kinase [Candidatus Sumerlaeota bacterium]|nr:HAMP domain-containing sensor histidine kinase [Candidatus Sumerlaeota bacterium]